MARRAAEAFYTRADTTVFSCYIKILKEKVFCSVLFCSVLFKIVLLHIALSSGFAFMEA